MLKYVLPAFGVLALALPAMATTTIQTKTVQLGTLDDAAISTILSFASFTSFGIVGEHLQSVTLDIDAGISGKVVATNNATGGTAASRRRTVAASYTLNGGAVGNGLDTSASSTQSQSRTIAGLGTSTTLTGLDPAFTNSDEITEGFAPFLGGSVDFAFDADALFAAVAAPNVVYGTPSITGGSAIVTLTYNSIVPEPASWAMLVTGFALVGGAVRRRARVAA
jgi:hypothetical protein